MTQKGWVKPDFGNEFSTQCIQGNSSKKSMYSSTNLVEDCHAITETNNMQNIPQLLLNSSELVVQKRKISELKTWLEQAFSAGSRAKFLLITGPPGSGKNETFRLLCNELNIQVLCWEEPIKHFNSEETEYGKYNGYNDRQSDVNFMDHIIEFFTRGNQYTSLKFKDTKGMSVEDQSKKLVLLKDFPPVILQNLDQWHSFLLKHAAKTKSPSVFIFTEDHSNMSMLSKLFPKNLKDKLMISTINFTGLAGSFISKAIQKYLSKERLRIPSCVVEEIVSSSNGDLRSALNGVNWIAKRNNVNLDQTNFKKRKSTKEEKSTIKDVYTRDSSLDFMHAMGKILYCKRLTSRTQNLSLPQHLFDKLRMPLKENTEELIRRVGDAPWKVLLYLHHNFPLFFHKIEDVSMAMECLSLADSLCNQLIDNECALLIGIRGVMHSNTSVNGSSWRPLKKPDFFAISEKQQSLYLEARNVGTKPTDGSFFSETLPFMKHIVSKSSSIQSSQNSYHVLEGYHWAFDECYQYSSAVFNGSLLGIGNNDNDCKETGVLNDETIVIEDFVD